VPFSGPQSQPFIYVMHSTTLYKTSHICTYFWKWVVSNHSSSTETTCGCSRVLHLL